MATKRKAKANAISSNRTASPRAGVAVISPCLWYDGTAEEAARLYVSIFPKAKITAVTRFPAVGQEVHGRPAGSVMTVDFQLNGVPFTALNGGPLFKFTEAVSLQVLCRTQAEIDYYWDKLRAGGDAKAQQCGWLKDKFGLSWQVAPVNMTKLMGNPRTKGGQRAFAAMMEMHKIDIAALKAVKELRR